MSFDYEVVVAGVRSDLIYMVDIDHTTASVGQTPARPPYSLRVTIILRRQHGE